MTAPTAPADYPAYARPARPPTADEYRRARNGDAAAREAVTLYHSPMVAAIARRFRSRVLDPADLIQAGTIGLMRAVGLYDVDSGYAFGTYADRWVRQAMGRAVLTHGGPVRVPVHIAGLAKRWRRAERRLAAATGREPGRREVDAAERLTARQAEKLDAARALRRVAWHDLTELAASDRVAVGPERRAEAADEAAWALGRIHGRQAEVLRRYFGIGGGPPETLAEVGRALGLSYQRVQRVRDDGLRALRRELGVADGGSAAGSFS